MQITVNTHRRRVSHGGTPRGWGFWGFTLNSGAGEPQVFWTTANYGDAKKQAVAEAQRLGHRMVTVLP